MESDSHKPELELVLVEPTPEVSEIDLKKKYEAIIINSILNGTLF